jgi:ribosome-binding protein aMBF1 (putative translation factor)
MKAVTASPTREAITAKRQAIARIRAFAAYKGWRKSRLAQEAGLRDTTLRGFDQEDWDPTFPVMEKIESIIPPEFLPTPAEAA